MSDYIEVDSVTQLLGVVAEPGNIDHHVFQNIDFSELADLAEQCRFRVRVTGEFRQHTG